MGAQADQSASGVPATDSRKAHLLQVLSNALRDQDITQQQYEQSIAWVNATPCEGVDRTLSSQRQARLEAALGATQGKKQVRIIQSFQDSGWLILYTEAREADNPYLFYSGDPAPGARPITAWSGGATIFETSEIAQWVKSNAPGIPSRLANCFAWHVTVGK
jgi:hypothetical protein